MSKNDLTTFDGKIGQLNWLANNSRPDVLFQTCFASGLQKNEDIYFVNKTINQVKNIQYQIKFPSFDMKNLELIVYTDASYNNLPNGGIQWGYIIFLSDGNNTAPISWRSIRIKRVVRSTITAETVSLADGCDAAYLVSNMVKEICRIFIRGEMFASCLSTFLEK